MLVSSRLNGGLVYFALYNIFKDLRLTVFLLHIRGYHLISRGKGGGSGVFLK